MAHKPAPFDKPRNPLRGILFFICALVIGGGIISTIYWLNLFTAGIFMLWSIAEFIPQTTLRSYIRNIGVIGVIILSVFVFSIWGYQIIQYLITRW